MTDFVNDVSIHTFVFTQYDFGRKHVKRKNEMKQLYLVTVP